LIHDIPLLLVFTSLVVIDFGWLGELLGWAVGGRAQGREKKVPGGKLFLVFFAVLAAASSFLSDKHYTTIHFHSVAAPLYRRAGPRGCLVIFTFMFNPFDGRWW
jgi:hypothetical protein